MVVGQRAEVWMRVAIYVSDEHAAPEAQLPQLRAWCAAGI
jgi:hypothetical protein